MTGDKIPSRDNVVGQRIFWVYSFHLPIELTFKQREYDMRDPRLGNLVYS